MKVELTHVGNIAHQIKIPSFTFYSGDPMREPRLLLRV